MDPDTPAHETDETGGGFVTGHVTINGNSYMLADPLTSSYNRTNYNPMAAQVGGGGEYDDLQEWSAWVMDDWRAGVGQRDAKGGGFLFAEAETRFPRRLTNPPYWKAAGVSRNNVRMPSDTFTSPIEGKLTLADGQKEATRFTASANGTINSIWVLAQGSATSTATNVALYSDSSGEPGSQLASVTLQLTDETGRPTWAIGTGLSQAVTSGTVYWVVVDHTEGVCYLPYCTVANAESKRDTGGGWSSQNQGFFFVTDNDPMNTAASVREWNNLGAQAFVSFNGAVYCASGNSVYKYASGAWSSVYAGSGNAILSMVVFADYIWLAFDGGGNCVRIDQAESSATVSATSAHLFTRWQGYLYRAHENDVYYTSDGSTWTGPLEVGPDDFVIRGMAGMGDTLYLSTEDGLWALMPGDAVVGVTPWPSYDPVNSSGNPSADVWNGRGMTTWQGSIYIPLDMGLVRYTPDGQLLQTGIDRGEGLPQRYAGRIVALAGTPNWLYALVDPATDTFTTGTASVWAWNGEGWHHIASFLNRDVGGSGLYYDRAGKRLFAGSRTGLVAEIDAPPRSENPLQGGGNFGQYGWVEFPKFFGGLREIYKDFESVYVSGEIGSGNVIYVYWRDENSTDWEELGSTNSDQGEMRWSNSGTRPNSRWIRLALLLEKNDADNPPIIEAVRVKFHPMLTDLLRWTLTIRVEDNIELLDHTIDARSSATIASDLDTVLKSVPPITFVDIDGTSYTVKAENGSLIPIRMEYNNSTQDFDAVYRIGLRQVVAN